jgi:hypothetical protein
MHSHWRASVLAVIGVLGVILDLDIGNPSAQALDPRVGTWKVNVARSKYSPGPPPQSQTLKVEPSGQGEKVTSEVVAADGKRTIIQYTANFDGKDYSLTGSEIANRVSLLRITTNTTVRSDKKGSTVAQTITRVVAPDGKTMHVAVIGTNAQGQKTDNVLFFEKQ